MGTKDRIQYIYCLYTIGSLLNIIRINSYLFMQLAENRVASPEVLPTPTSNNSRFSQKLARFRITKEFRAQLLWHGTRRTSTITRPTNLLLRLRRQFFIRVRNGST